MEDFKHITFEQMTAMPIGERKILAQRIIEAGLEHQEKPSIREWGRFTDLPGLSEEQIGMEAHRLLALMSLEQKIAQMTPNTTVVEYIPACLKYNDFPYVAGEDPQLEIPGIRFSDGPTGVVMGRSSTCFPVSMGRGATWDVELEEKVGEVMGIEARSLGANLFGGVCINLLRHPAWGRSQETYGEDPLLLGSMGSALVRGVQKHVMACVKHYALNSMENSRYKVNVDIDERSLRELYLDHFRTCVENGVAAVMSSYNQVRGDYCGENRYLLRSVLKEEWGFKGIVISDFIHGLYDARKAVLAGLDIEMPIEGHFGRNLLELVKHGQVAQTIIDEAVLRILSTKIRFSKVGCSDSYCMENLASPKHTALARLVALKSTVLLKNQDNLLPLDKTQTRHLVVAGSLADRPNIGEMKGSSHVYPPYVVTPLEGLRQAFGDSTQIAYFPAIDEACAQQAVAMADAVVLVVGLTSDDEGEYIPHWNSGCGGDRVDLGLSVADKELIAKATLLNSRTIVVLQGGGAIITEPWDTSVAAILMTWYPGMEGGHALAEILTGAFNPCGKLPLTIPRSMDQLPYFDKDAHKITYGYFHGYYLTDREDSNVSYPFGYGLSYTSYRYSQLVVHTLQVGEQDTVRLSVTVTNIGDMAGEEIVQLYTGYQNSAVLRHEKDLRAFQKVSLPPKASLSVAFSLPVKKLAYWDTQVQDWKVEHISYTALVGPSSKKSDLLSSQFSVG